MNIAIIPARAGSKRIKNKNIKLFNGKPIIYYAIKKAINSKIFKKVIVSTDSYKIKKISEKYGADVPFLRPDSLSDDFAGTIDVIKHAIKKISNKNDKNLNICCIYPATPLLKKNDLINSYKIFKKKKCSFLFAASNFSYPVQRGFVLNKNGYLQMINKKNYKSRSQDLEPVYHDAGQFYWGSSNDWNNSKMIYGNKSSVYLLPRIRAQDIDTLEDWNIAKKLYKLINEKN